MKRMASVSLALFALTLQTSATQPLPQHGLTYDKPAMVWDEAMPLGNGLLGALVWGDGHPLKISLDRTDLWDLRPVPEFHSDEYSYELMRQWVAQKRVDDLRRVYERPYDINPGPTKIPAGRIELELGAKTTFTQAHLDLATATATTDFGSDVHAEIFVHAVDRVGLIRVRGAGLIQPRLVVPSFGGTPTKAQPGGMWELELAHLGYPDPERHGGEDWSGYVQQGWGELRFAVVLAWKQSGAGWLGAWSIQTNANGVDPLAAAREACEKALAAGFAAAHRSHEQWWHDYWAQSAIHVPNAVIERQWYLETYKFGAAARADTPPITLQGPWTADNGQLPPWRGDYHHDLNTQLSYWPCYSGNHLEGGLGYLEWLWRTKPNAEDWTRRFFGLPGLNVPMTTDLNCEQIGGWHQYTHSATTAAWLAHHFYLHWRYSMDRDFLRDRAYPWLRESAVFLEAITEVGDDGQRMLPLSSSPEINDNRLDAWFPKITNYDLALVRWTFEKTAELADALDKAGEAAHWRARLAEMPQLAMAGEDGRLLVAPDYPLQDSHRHFSHLMAYHPLGLIRWEDGPSAQRTITASLAELDRLGSNYWTGYSFAWLASLRARARDGDGAARAIEVFSTAFCLRNGFHVNGDQSGEGYSRFTYRPFTLEGNFAAAAGIQEMLLQSYSGVIRIFPAIPENWADVSFRTLRAEGAFLVSAAREDGRTTLVEVTAERGGRIRLEDPFGGAPMVAEGIGRNEMERDDGMIQFDCAPGQRVALRRVKE